MVPSPNTWRFPDVYELENQSLDADGVLEPAMLGVHDWTGQVVVDVGCGAGFHLPALARRAARVVGVEPHPPLLSRARARVRLAGLTDVEVLSGTAQALPLPDASVDVAVARLAYFFGPGCEPGLAELARVLRRGGTAFVIDHDGSRSTYGRWFTSSTPRYDPVAVQRFWDRHGWTTRSLDTVLRTRDRAGFEAVVRIELPPPAADRALAEVTGVEVDHAIALRHRTF
ncbi:class I SAM-dependent methyltransferase [Angustibacter aerolatus]